MNNKVIVLDTETTGITNHPTRGHPEIIELAYIDISGELDEIRLIANLPKQIAIDAVIATTSKSHFISRYNPSMEIHPEATNIHGIIKRDLLGERSSVEAKIPEDTTYLLGHNIQYDHRCLGKPDVKLLCTMKLAKQVQRAGISVYENHKLDTLVNYYYPDHRNVLITPKHTALGDVIKTLLVFIRLLGHLPGIKSWEELYNFQTKVKL